MKDKEKSTKGRYLSPSFRKGVVKEKRKKRMTTTMVNLK